MHHRARRVDSGHRMLAVALAGWLALLGLLAWPPASASAGDAAIYRTWERTDKPVAAGQATRTWMWGPALTPEIRERDTGSPSGERTVQYFDKSRMEIATAPDADPNSIWYVTNGLLASELVTGRLQLGPNDWETRSPAAINLGGDPDDPNGPTYASFSGHLADAPLANGSLVTQRIDRSGNVHDDPALAAQAITALVRVSVPGIDHQVASVFWEFMTAGGVVYEHGYRWAPLFENPFYATGYPITEPYWTEVRVGGTPKLVLAQVFERRVLTYTPDNPVEWQVEAGNVGRHYYEWRYGALPAEPGPAMYGFMDAFEGELHDLVNAWDGWNAVSVTDLSTGRTVGVHGDRQQPAACTIKIFIMVAIAQDIERGEYSTASVEDLVLSAMGPSNTWPAMRLLEIAGDGNLTAGVQRVNRIMREMGMTRSVLRHPPDFADVDHGYGTGDNLLTTDDLNIALGNLWRGEYVSGWARDYVLWSMTLAIPGQQYSLGGGIPESATLYHKIGLIYAPYNTWNDAGIVVFERHGVQRAYAISYLGSYSDPWINSYYRGREASALTWRWFDAAYR